MSPDDLEAYARALAAQHGLDPDFVAAIGHAESGFKPDAVSKAGAMGPMQLMPATAKDLGVNPADPYDNVRGGVQYLAKLNDQFGGDPSLVAAAYNAGPGAVQKAGGVPNFPETQAYVAKVTKPVAIDPTKVQWDSPPAIDPSKVQWDKPAGPSKEDVQSAMLKRQALGGLPFFGSFAPDVVAGAAEVPAAVVQAAAHGANVGAQGVDSALNSARDFYNKQFQPDAVAPGAGVARGVGQGIATAPLTPVKAAAGLIGATGQGAGLGALTSALTPVYGDTSNFGQQKLDQLKQGAIAGAATGGLFHGLGRLLSPNTSDQVQTLVDAGINTTPGQTMGGVAKSIEDKLTSVPLLGDAIKSAQRRTIDQFNRAVYVNTLAPLGPSAAKYAQSLPVGNEGIQKVGNYLSDSYEKVLAQSVPSTVDQPFIQATTQLAGMVPSSVRQDFIDTLQSRVASKVTNGVLTPSAAKAAESDLGQAAADARQRAPELWRALTQAQANLREMVARSNPDTAPIIQNINKGWANLTQLENAGSMLGAKEGVISPANFLNAIKKSDNSVRDRAFARGTVRNQGFAQAADAVLPNKYPDSGSIGRALMAGALGGGGAALAAAHPVAMGAGAAAMLPYTPMGQSLATMLLARRPDVVRALGTGVKTMAPFLGMAAPAAGLLSYSP